MNIYLMASAVLVVLVALIHSMLGERLIITPIQQTPGLPAVRGSDVKTKATLRFAWHVTSVFGLGIAAVLFYYARLNVLNAEQIVTLRIFSCTFFVSFVVSLIGAKAQHPSWVAFALLSIVVFLGAR